MIDRPNREIWFVTGSQDLYGQETLQKVAQNSREIVEGLKARKAIPLDLILKPVLTTPDAISRLCHDANSSPSCAGLIAWMHTFSPAKIWLGGLRTLSKPLAHLHTQYNRDLPWSFIDMDFMNLNQAAHGDREFGHLAMRIGLKRKVVVGHWQDLYVQERLAAWARAATGWQEAQ